MGKGSYKCASGRGQQAVDIKFNSFGAMSKTALHALLDVEVVISSLELVIFGGLQERLVSPEYLATWAFVIHEPQIP